MKTDNTKDMPGYPSYPAEEDMMSLTSPIEKVDMDVEEITSAEKSSSNIPAMSKVDTFRPVGSAADEDLDEDLEFVPGNDADVTEEEIEALGDPDGDLDEGEDEIYKRAELDPLEIDEEPLDIPGAELDDDMEALGTEDEENNYYSLGDDEENDSQAD